MTRSVGISLGLLPHPQPTPEIRLNIPAPRRRALRSLIPVAAALWLAGVQGCGSPDRPTLTDAEFAERAARDQAAAERAFADSVTKTLNRAEREAGADRTIDFLAMSGGGDYGAFGAGFLVGWGSAPGDNRRPNFDVVTGVSTGALLAPFAFLGTDESCLQVEQFYRNPKADWIRERGMFFFLPFNPSFMEIPGLERDIRATINAEFVGRIADESRTGKVLAISATDLDLGRQRYWDVGAEAESATTKEGVDRVQSILLASAAIPAVFPPVKIDDGVYADGGVTANVFLRLDDRNPNSLIPRWKAAHPGESFPKLRYWIIVNNQLNQPPQTVQIKWPSVVAPSLATAIRSATVAEIRWISAQADYINAMHGADIEVRVVAIPDDWRAPVKGDFRKETMASLADLGRKMGADPSSWKVWAAPVSRAH